MEPSRGRSDLNVKLVWLTVFRAVATSLLLAVTAIPLLIHPVDLSPQESLSFAVIGIVYGLTLVYSLTLRRGRAGPATAYVQVLGDIVLASALVYLTGGVESPFTFTFSLAVIAAAIVLDERGALVAASASTTVYSVLALLSLTRLLHPPGAAEALSRGRLAFLWATNAVAQFLVAALASYLSRQLTAAGGALRAREADLRRLAQLQEQILAAMPSGLVTGDEAGSITFVNRAGRVILGLRPEGRLEGQLSDIFPGIETLSRDARRHELVVDTPAGQRTLGLAVARLQGGPSGALIVFQDLTELRRAERELRRVDKLASLGSLSAQLAHEVRNPLSAMRGAAQMLADGALPDLTHARLTTILVREADRLSALVDDFLRFARPPEPQRTAQDLAPLLAETVEMIKLDGLAEGIKLETTLESLEAWVDGGQLKQVVLNLLRNAVVAARSGGKVRVELSQSDGCARILVWDSAGAIAEENLGRIFEPFFTTREGGTGLGLSTAHSIVRAHQGEIHVSSSPAKGTEFVIELPVGEARRASVGS